MTEKDQRKANILKKLKITEEERIDLLEKNVDKLSEYVRLRDTGEVQFVDESLAKTDKMALIALLQYYLNQLGESDSPLVSQEKILKETGITKKNIYQYIKCLKGCVRKDGSSNIEFVPHKIEKYLKWLDEKTKSDK